MVDERFEDWLSSANCAERCAAALQLCALVDEGTGRADDTLARLLHRFAEDASPKVRRVIAVSLSSEWRAPASLMRVLASDIDSIATVVVCASPHLTADHLLELVLTGSSAVRSAIAGRTPLAARLATAIVRSGDVAACRALLDNPDAVIGTELLETIADLAGTDAPLREQLGRRPGLPPHVRQALVRAVSSDLAATGLVANLLGERARRLTDDTCRSATLSIAAGIARGDLPRFTERLRDSGEISTILLVETALAGELDFFAANLATLSGVADARVRRMIVDTRDAPLHALLERAGIPIAARTLLLLAVRHWKEAAHSRSGAPSASAVLDAIAARFLAETRGEAQDEFVRLIARLRMRAAQDELRRSAVSLKQAA